MAFAEKLIRLRKREGWSQEALAESLGVSRQAVSRWERDETMPDSDKIVALADLFGVTTDYLLRRTAAGRPSGHSPTKVPAAPAQNGGTAGISLTGPDTWRKPRDICWAGCWWPGACWTCWWC